MKNKSFFILAAFCLLLTGCAFNSTEPTKNELTIGFPQGGTESNWRKVQKSVHQRSTGKTKFPSPSPK